MANKSPKIIFLRECWRCAGKARIDERGRGFWAGHCHACGVSGPVANDKEAAAAAWNERAADLQISFLAELARLALAKIELSPAMQRLAPVDLAPVLANYLSDGQAVDTPYGSPLAWTIFQVLNAAAPVGSVLKDSARCQCGHSLDNHYNNFVAGTACRLCDCQRFSPAPLHAPAERLSDAG